MTGFEVERFTFSPDALRSWAQGDPRRSNWPVVYVMSDAKAVYVGESVNAEARMRQHLESPVKRSFQQVRVVLDETFNKSACLDLEAFLIRMFFGDGEFTVKNLNAGMTDANYYNRSVYRETFEEVFESLRVNEHLFQRTIPEIVNRDLFKLSPYKSLNHDQAVAVEDILEGLFADLETQTSSISVVRGDPGTGKTILAIYLIKLLVDIQKHDQEDALDADSIFSDFFTPENSRLLSDLRVGLVIPQQSLRKSVGKVFKATPGLGRNLVLSASEVGSSAEKFDLLVVDEAHRLNQRASLPGLQNRDFPLTNKRLFGNDDRALTQVDWIEKQSRHVIYLLDGEQSVRPADLPPAVTADLIRRASVSSRLYPLHTQMRISASEDYVSYVRSLLSDSPPAQRQDFSSYDFRMFDDLGEMYEGIKNREAEFGLARLVAGYAWKWVSRKDKAAFDIVEDGHRFRWNATATDWINSPTSIHEVGSIHTVQGYDLNYAGVLIGRDLRFDPQQRRIVFDRKNYFDTKGKENNKQRGITYTDDDVLRYVRNIYRVLMTRGIRGTYVYVCDPELREHLRPFI